MAEEKKNQPDYTVSVPVDLGNNETYWHNIGVGFKGEKGISIKLNSLPLSGKIMLFPYKAKEK